MSESLKDHIIYRSKNFIYKLRCEPAYMKFQPNQFLKFKDEEVEAGEETTSASSCSSSHLQIMEEEDHHHHHHRHPLTSPSSNSNLTPLETDTLQDEEKSTLISSSDNSNPAAPIITTSTQPVKKRVESVCLAVERVVNGYGDSHKNGTTASITGSTYQLPPSPEHTKNNNTLKINKQQSKNSTTTALVSSETYITPPHSPNCEKQKQDQQQQVVKHQNSTPQTNNPVITTTTTKLAPKLSFSKKREIKKRLQQHNELHNNGKLVQFHLKKSFSKKSIGVQKNNNEEEVEKQNVVQEKQEDKFTHHLQKSASDILTPKIGKNDEKTQQKSKNIEEDFYPLYKILPPSCRPETKLCKAQLFQERQNHLSEADMNSVVKTGQRVVQTEKEQHDLIMKSSLSDEDNNKLSSSSDSESSKNNNNNHHSSSLYFETLADSLQNALNIQKNRYLHKHDVMKMVPRKELFPKRMIEPGSTDNKVIPTSITDAFTERSIKRAVLISNDCNTSKVLWQGLSAYTSKEDLQTAFRFAEEKSCKMSKNQSSLKNNNNNNQIPNSSSSSSSMNQLFGRRKINMNSPIMESSSKTHQKNSRESLKSGSLKLSNKRSRDGHTKKLERLRVKEIMTPEYNKIITTSSNSVPSSISSSNLNNLNSPPVLLDLSQNNNNNNSTDFAIFSKNQYPALNSKFTSNTSSSFTQTTTTTTPNTIKFNMLPDSRKRQLLDNSFYETNHEAPKDEERKRIFAFHDSNTDKSRKGGGGSSSRSGVANSLPDYYNPPPSSSRSEPDIQFFTKSGKYQENTTSKHQKNHSLYMRGRHKLDLDESGGYKKPNFPVSLLDRKTVKYVNLSSSDKVVDKLSKSEKRKKQATSQVLSDCSSSSESEIEEEFEFKPRQKRQRKLSERKLLSLEQEKPSTSRRRTIAGGEENNTTTTENNNNSSSSSKSRGNKRGHKHFKQNNSNNNNNNNKREWKLSETDNKSKEKIILKFKHRKKE